MYHLVQGDQAYQVVLHGLYLPLVLEIQVAHPYLYHPLVLTFLVYQIQVTRAFLANLVVRDDLSHLACLAVLAGHFGLASLDQVHLEDQAVLLHQVAQVVLALQGVLCHLVALVALVPHLIQVFQSQAALLGQQVLGALGALCDQVVRAGPSPCLLWVQVIQEVLADLCDLAPLWALVGLVIPVPLVYLFLVDQVVLEDPEALAAQLALLLPLGPFLLVAQHHHFLLACQVVLAILVCPFQALLVDRGSRGVLQVPVVHYLVVQEVLEVPLAQVAQLVLVLLGEFLQHH